MAFGSKHLRYEKRGGIGWLTLDRPEARNACTLEMYSGIAQACAVADDDPDIQLTVITGVGDVFCPGGDMRGDEHLIENPGSASASAHMGNEEVDGEGQTRFRDPFTAIQEARKLVISAVNGICQGGGFIIAMVSDLAIVSDRATFRVPELLRGVADAFICTRLPLYVGMERAKWLMFTCERLDAETAHNWGLVSEVVPHERLYQRVEEVCDLVLATGPDARADYKAQANRYMIEPDWGMFLASLQSEECREGFAAFSEKRAPSWVLDQGAATPERP